MIFPLLVLGLVSLPWTQGDNGSSSGNSPPQPGNLLGARTPMSITSPEAKRVTQFATTTFNKGHNSAYYFRDTKILKAEKQLVSGTKYFLTVEMGSTDCRKGEVAGDEKTLATCPFSTEQEKLHCEFEILEVPWRNETTLQKTSCSRI